LSPHTSTGKVFLWYKRASRSCISPNVLELLYEFVDKEKKSPGAESSSSAPGRCGVVHVCGVPRAPKKSLPRNGKPGRLARTSILKSGCMTMVLGLPSASWGSLQETRSELVGHDKQTHQNKLFSTHTPLKFVFMKSQGCVYIPLGGRASQEWLSRQRPLWLRGRLGKYTLL